MAKEEIEHKKKRVLYCFIAILIALLAYSVAQSAQDTADINNIFEVVVNNTNLAPDAGPPHPPGTGERVSGVKYWANDSPIEIFVFAHASSVSDTAEIHLSINDTIVADTSGRPLGGAESSNKTVVAIIPKGANYSVEFLNFHHYEWREYPILSGKNGTLNITQILNASGDFIPYLGANKNVTVGVNNFTIFSMDGNSSIYLPNTTNNGILIQQYQNAAHTQEGSIYINGTIQQGILNGVLNQNATYGISQTAHTFRINNTDKAIINKAGIFVSNITSTGINNGDYPNTTLESSKVNKSGDTMTGRLNILGENVPLPSSISTINTAMNITADVNAINGVLMGNNNSGTSTDFRFLITDGTSDGYVAFMYPGRNNAVTGLFGGNTRNKSAFIITSRTSNRRNLTIGTVQADDVVFGTTNIERMRINDKGNVTIGTTNSTSRLVVGNSGDGSQAWANSWNTYSSMEYKTEIHNATWNIPPIQPIGYKQMYDNTSTIYYGFKAEDLPPGLRITDGFNVGANMMAIIAYQQDVINKQQKTINKICSNQPTLCQ